MNHQPGNRSRLPAGFAVAILSRVWSNLSFVTKAAVVLLLGAAAVVLLVKVAIPPDVSAMVSDLKNASSHEQWEVRRRAFYELKDPRALQQLTELLHDSSEEVSVRGLAAYALGNIARPAAVASLVAVMEDATQPAELRRAAGGALGRVKTKSSVDALIRALRPTDRAYGPELDLAQMGKIAQVPLVAALDDPDSLFAMRALRTLTYMHDPKVLPDLIIRLSGSNSRIRRDIAYALGEFRHRQAADALLRVLESNQDDPSTRAAAAYSLGKTREPRVLQALASALAVDCPDVRVAAAHSIGTIGDSTGVATLMAALHDVCPVVCSAAAVALSRVRSRAAVDALLAELAGHNLHVVASASDFFIGRAEPGSDTVLGMALESCGSVGLAEDLLNSHNQYLESVAVRWANRHGYSRSPWAVPGSATRWGELR